MKVLITGGAGFIGSHLAAHFHRTADVRVLRMVIHEGRKGNFGALRGFVRGMVDF